MYQHPLMMGFIYSPHPVQTGVLAWWEPKEWNAEYHFTTPWIQARLELLELSWDALWRPFTVSSNSNNLREINTHTCAVACVNVEVSPQACDAI